MKPFVLALLIDVCWIVVTQMICVFFTARDAQPRSSPERPLNRVRIAGLALTGCTAVLVLLLVLLLVRFNAHPGAAIEVIHDFGLVLLGTFLGFALFFQLEIRQKVRRSCSPASIVRTYRRWSGLTELLPAPAAIIILVSGMGLLYVLPGYSIKRGWIFVLVTALAAMMADGLLGYTPDVRRLFQAAKLAAEEQ